MVIATVSVLFAVAGFWLIYSYKPVPGGVFPPCPFLWLTGLYCPGCGALRAIHEMLHLHWRQAFSLNPLVVISAPILFIYFAHFLLRRIGWINLPTPKPLPSYIYFVLLSGILLFGVLRNIHIYPFNLLAPQ